MRIAIHLMNIAFLKEGIPMLDAALQYCTNKTVVMRTTILAHNYSFYMITTGYVTADYGFYTTRSERPDIFLLYTVSGSGKMTWHNETVELSAHSVCMIDCHDYHHFQTTSQNEPWIYYYIHFNGQGLNAYAPYLLDKLRVLYPIHENTLLSYFELFQRNELRNDILSLSKINLIITEMIHELILARFDLLSSNITEQYDCIFPAYEYIRTHYKENITVDILCELCNMSKYYFLHTFKKAIGESPYRYLSRYRINCAKELLVSTTDSIESIAHMVGYANYSNFVIQFRKLTDVTPNEYRNATISNSHSPGENNFLVVK